MYKSLCFALIFIVNCQALAGGEPDLSAIAASPAWTKLFHAGEIKNPGFYASGRPDAGTIVELTANIREFETNPNYPCLFPARAKFLGARLQRPYAECPAVADWKKDFAGAGLSMVYVSQYVSNPASAFGHTFLLFRKKNGPVNFDVVISNAARVSDDVGDFDYVYRGISGGFPAKFSSDLFYRKVQEYVRMENRDLWIYDLDFSAAQIDDVLDHLWELTERASQDYYFLNGNCAVNGYDLLAAVHPALELIPSGEIFVLPAETMKKLSPVTKKTEYVPSLRGKIVRRSMKLSARETASVRAAVSGEAPVDPAAGAAVTELILDHFELLRSRQAGTLTPEQTEKFREALVHRAGLGAAPEIEIPAPEPPHLALPPGRAALSGGRRDEHSFSAVSVAPFFHSLLEKSAGYLPFSEFILLNVEVQRHPGIDRADLTVLQMANFPSKTLFDWPWSWRGRAGLASRDFCDRCWVFDGELSLGKSLEWRPRHSFFALAGAIQGRALGTSPQLSAGGLAETEWGNGLYQVRLLQDADAAKLRTFYDLGFNWPLGENSSLDFAGTLEDRAAEGRLSASFHF